MKVLISVINSKYIHSCLAAWYLKASCNKIGKDIEVKEYTINNSIEFIFRDILKQKPEVLAFPCYIWNIEIVSKLIENIKNIYPNIIIIVGGPEVSYDNSNLNSLPIDYIIRGEGEEVFPKIIMKLENNERISEAFKEELNKFSIIKDLNTIQSPYLPEMIEKNIDKIIYFESSRGCPFNCSYCLSSTYKGVRYFNIDRVFDEIKKLVEYEVNQIKFVDRTFNCNMLRAKAIITYIKNLNPKKTTFNFEISAELIDDAFLELISDLPDGLIQFEAGIQSVHSDVLKAVNRASNIDKLFNRVKRINEMGNIHLHVDLIAGLPFETLNRFKESFNKVISLRPQNFQLGFLKLLKGTKIRDEKNIYEYIFNTYPPYELLKNKFLSYEEIICLKRIEEVLERYYNSGRFINSLV